MPIAFVLINAETGVEANLLKNLRNIEGVDEAYIVYGVYDLVVKINATSTEIIKEIITSRIRELDKIRSTLTLAVIQ